MKAHSRSSADGRLERTWSNTMSYSEVVKSGQILPKKEKYTMKDVKKLAQEKGIAESQARFVCVCSAIYHDTDYSKYLGSYHSQENQVKRMVGAK